MKVSKDVKKMRYYESTLLNAYKVGNLYFNNIRSFDAELDFGSLLAYLFISTEFIMYPVTRCAFMSFFFFLVLGHFLILKLIPIHCLHITCLPHLILICYMTSNI